MRNTFEHVEANVWSCLVSILALSMRVLAWQKPLQYHRIIGYHWDPVLYSCFDLVLWLEKLWVFADFTTVSHQGLHSELHGESLSGAHAPFEGWICCRLESFGGHFYPANWWMQNRWISTVKAIEAVQQRTYCRTVTLACLPNDTVLLQAETLGWSASVLYILLKNEWTNIQTSQNRTLKKHLKTQTSCGQLCPFLPHV